MAFILNIYTITWKLNCLKLRPRPLSQGSSLHLIQVATTFGRCACGPAFPEGVHVGKNGVCGGRVQSYVSF